ncbi:MAG: hypothetical protein WCL00_02805 [Bacteroidota bacterium]
MKKAALTLLLGMTTVFGFTQEYMDKILEKTCDCIEKIPDTLEVDKFNMALGLCMIDASMPYKKQLRKDYDINMDKIDTEGEKLGKMLGVKMASYCPAMVLKFSDKNKRTSIKQKEDGAIAGVITKIEKDFFVTFSIKDDDGKIVKVYWMKFFESNIEMTTEYPTLIGKSVNISYRKEEYFDPRIDQYRQFFIIVKLSVIE